MNAAKKSGGLSLSHKLIAGFLGSGLLAAIAVGGGAYFVSSNIVEKDINHQLELATDGILHGLNSYKESVEADLEFLSSAVKTKEGLASFEKAWGRDQP